MYMHIFTDNKAAIASLAGVYTISRLAADLQIFFNEMAKYLKETFM